MFVSLSLLSAGCHGRRHHFQTMLLDHVDAPPPVLSYLCSKYSIHNIPIAGNLSAAQIEEVGHGSTCVCVLWVCCLGGGTSSSLLGLWCIQFERNLSRSVTFLRYFTETTEVSCLISVQCCPCACMRYKQHCPLVLNSFQ